jgi:glc operon protein GlcG
MEDPMLTLSKAKRIINGAIVKARELGVDISVAVCDVGGHLIAFNRMDGAFWDVDHSCIGKAVAAAVIGRPSEELAGRLMASGRPGAVWHTVVTPRGRRGGLPLFQGGILEGACGVSGAHTNEQDEECARAGIAVLDGSRELNTQQKSGNSPATSGRSVEIGL